MATLGEFLEGKRGDRTLEEIRAALQARGVEVDHSTVARWFKGGLTARIPQLTHWAALCDVLGLTNDDLRSVQELLVDKPAASTDAATADGV